MKRRFRVLLQILVMLLVTSQSVFAATKDQLSCSAWLSYDDEPTQRIELSIAPYDTDFLEAHLEDFSYLVDTYFLPDEGVSLMIYNKTTSQYTQAILGFRRIQKTKFREARLTFARHHSEAEPQAQLVCVLTD